MYYAPYALHFPIQAKEEDRQYCDQFKYGGGKAKIRRELCALAVGVDASIGGLTAEMERLFPNDNYLLFITSDNGGAVKYGSKNTPLSGGKSSAADGGIRNNVLIWGKHPELTAAKGSKYTGGFMHLTDWHMTIAHLGHATPYDGWNPGKLPSLLSDGMNIWEALVSNGESPRSKEGLINSYLGFIYRKGSYKLLVDEGQMRYAHPKKNNDPRCENDENARGDGVHLYNIDEDPKEKCDLAVSERELADSLKKELQEKIDVGLLTKTDGKDTFVIYDWENECPDLTRGKPAGEMNCKNPKYNPCCNEKLFGDTKYDLALKWGAKVEGNQCNNKNKPSTQGTVYAQYPYYEETGSRRRVGVGKQAITCEEPPFDLEGPAAWGR